MEGLRRVQLRIGGFLVVVRVEAPSRTGRRKFKRKVVGGKVKDMLEGRSDPENLGYHVGRRESPGWAELERSAFPIEVNWSPTRCT